LHRIRKQIPKTMAKFVTEVMVEQQFHAV
jgi:hypothetical protein